MKRQRKQFEKCDMTPVDLEETLKYFKIQESLRFENLTKHYLRRGIFYMIFPTRNNIIQAQSKTNPCIT